MSDFSGKRCEHGVRRGLGPDGEAALPKGGADGVVRVLKTETINALLAAFVVILGVSREARADGGRQEAIPIGITVAHATAGPE